MRMTAQLSDICELIRQASVSLSHDDAAVDGQCIELYPLQPDAAQRQPCVQATRYRRQRHGRVLPPSVPIIYRLVALGAMPLHKSQLATIWEADEGALARHEWEVDASSPWRGRSLLPSAVCCSAAVTSDSEMPSLHHKRGRTSDTMTAPTALTNTVPVPPTMEVMLRCFEDLKRARFAR
mmetsp:Transcript_59813/g.143008  ORF Transcript_59813/g.143008 Transcript_59813/m.143008 type:complete len:180 (-) Transcript_59813:79-618(-)